MGPAPPESAFGRFARVGKTVPVTVHNAAQTWAWEDGEVVFEAACECGWHGPARSAQREAVHDTIVHTAGQPANAALATRKVADR